MKTRNYTMEDLEKVIDFTPEDYAETIKGREMTYQSYTHFLAEIRSNCSELDDAANIAEKAYDQMVTEIETLNNKRYYLK